MLVEQYRTIDTHGDTLKSMLAPLRKWHISFGEDFNYTIEYEFSPSSIQRLGECFINLKVLSSTDAPANAFLVPVWLHKHKMHELPTIYWAAPAAARSTLTRSPNSKATMHSSELDWHRIIYDRTRRTRRRTMCTWRGCARSSSTTLRSSSLSRWRPW